MNSIILSVSYFLNQMADCERNFVDANRLKHFYLYKIKKIEVIHRTIKIMENKRIVEKKIFAHKNTADNRICKKFLDVRKL